MYRIYPLPLRLALAIWGYESLPYSTSGLSWPSTWLTADSELDPLPP